MADKIFKEKLIEEFERIICVREHLRRHIRENPPQHPVTEQKMLNDLAYVNDLILKIKETLNDGGPLEYMALVEETKRTP